MHAAPVDNDPYYTRMEDLLLRVTEIHRSQVALLARNVTILLHNFQAGKHRADVHPANPALISCRATNEVKFFFALVKSKGAETEILIRGDATEGREQAIGGLIARMEWLLWTKVGRTNSWIE